MSITDLGDWNTHWDAVAWATLNNKYATRTIAIYDVDFSISLNDPTAVHNILTQGYDLSQCGTNCSNQGSCSVGPNMTYVCNCFPNYIGSTCNVDKRPCSAAPCLNNGTCSQRVNSEGAYDFTCDCLPNYTGERCQNFDLAGLCANLSCANGNCQLDKATSTVSCSCFPKYSGARCEIESEEMKSIKRTIGAASIIAIISIVAFYSLILALDLMDYFIIRKEKERLKLRAVKPVKKQFKYKAGFMDSKKYVIHGDRREIL
jgi:hypothetical protein